MGSRPDDRADHDRDQRAGTALPHTVVLTSCVQPMRQNLAVFDFALEPADEAAISALISPRSATANPADADSVSNGSWLRCRNRRALITMRRYWRVAAVHGERRAWADKRGLLLAVADSATSS